MKKCIKCGAFIINDDSNCPLCSAKLEDVKNAEDKKVIAPYPPYKAEKQTRSMIRNFFLFLFILISLTCGALNIVFYKEVQNLWSLVVIASYIFIWILVNSIILAKHNLASKLVALSLMISCLLIVIDISLDYNNKMWWSLNYILPLCLSVGIVVTTILVAVKNNKANYFFSLLILNILSLFPLIGSFFIPVIYTEWPAIVAFGLGATSLLAMFTIFRKQTINEIKKRFFI